MTQDKTPQNSTPQKIQNNTKVQNNTKIQQRITQFNIEHNKTSHHEKYKNTRARNTIQHSTVDSTQQNSTTRKIQKYNTAQQNTTEDKSGHRPLLTKPLLMAAARVLFSCRWNQRKQVEGTISIIFLILYYFLEAPY